MAVIFDKILGEIVLHNHTKFGSSDPSVAADFDFFYNTAENKLKLFYDGTWYVLHTLTVPDVLLLENDDFALLESGEKVLLEG